MPANTVCKKERFDYDRLKYIINHFDELKPQMRESIFKDNDYNPLSIIRDYFKKSKKGVIDVKYKQNQSKGRYWALKSLSLQSLPREIRHTISQDYYIDIDVANCHPVILRYLCRENGYLCDKLDYYIKNREKVFEELGFERDVLKTGILSLINGGQSSYKDIQYNCKILDGVENEFLEDFKNELKIIHKNFTVLHNKDWKKFERKRIKEGRTFNIEAGFMNTILCDFENKILQCMNEKLGNPEDCVWCFDGIMVPKDKPFSLKTIEDYIKEILNIDITLKIKEMNEGLTLPEEIIEDEIIIPELKLTEVREDYSWYDFKQELRKNQPFKNYDNMMTFILDRVPRVVGIATFGEGMIIKKEGEGNYSLLKTNKLDDRVYHLDKDGKHIMIPFLYHFQFKNNLPLYNRIVYNPKMDHKESEFNTWFPFVSNNPCKDDDYSKLDELIDFIKEVVCYNDNEKFIWLISYIKEMIMFPWRKTKIALLLRSTEQQVGKGVFCNFLQRMVFGTHCSGTITGFSQITQRFNSVLMNKQLLVIDELPSTRSEFYSNFDILKNLITEPTISIEKKGIEPFSMDSFVNIICCSNNSKPLHIEQDDKRWQVFEINPKYKGVASYWDNLVNNVMTEETGRKFYKYLEEFKDFVNIRNILQTRELCEMKEMCLSPLHMFKVHMEKGEVNPNACIAILEKTNTTSTKMRQFHTLEGEYKVKPEDLFLTFKKWCESNNIKYTNVRSTQLKKVFEKKRGQKGMFYIINIGKSYSDDRKSIVREISYEPEEVME